MPNPGYATLGKAKISPITGCGTQHAFFQPFKNGVSSS
jgi:hypothetical protein